MESNFELFVGRFHPLVVHLPIGFLFLALILDVISSIVFKDSSKMGKAVSFAYMFGGISGLMAVATGWLLAGGGGYSDGSVDWHRWMGVFVTLLAFLAWLLKSERLNFPVRVYHANTIMLVTALFFTGHLGGNLTHGSNYLIEHAPKPLKVVFGNLNGSKSIQIPENPDSVNVYNHLVHPVLDAKCLSCHNPSKAKGGLDMSDPDSLMAGGDELIAVVPGKPLESGIFQRTTLPFDHSKFMPPKGNPLEYNEIRILEWWIEGGASFEISVSDLDRPEEITAILQEKYGLDARPRPFYETVSIDSLPESEFIQIIESGFKGGTLSEDNNYLSLSVGSSNLKEGGIKNLLNAKDHIIDLDLSRSDLEDEDLAIIGQLENLYSLNLNNTSITDVGLESIVGLQKLEILNLYGTSVTDVGLSKLKELTSLKKVYLWQTGASKKFVDDWTSGSEGLQVVMGE